MKIAYVTADFGVPVRGTKGASVHVRRVVAALRDLGHDLLLLTASPGDADGIEPACRMVEVPLRGAWPIFHESLKHEDLCRDTRLPKDMRNLAYANWFQVEAGPLLQEFQPDLVYERYSLFGTAGLQLARGLGVPFILEVNAPLVEEQQKQRGLSLPKVARTTQEFLFREADHVVVVSSWLKDYVIAHGTGAARVSVIPNAADPDVFCPLDGTPVRERLGWQDRFVLGYVGSMKDWHGVETVLEALKTLAGPRSPIRLLLVGDGPRKQSLERLAREHQLQDHVHFTGSVAHDQVPQWVAAMDVALAPYAAAADSYFSPVKLFEYMAMGRPVVAARIGQTDQIIEDGRTGWLYPPGDSRALADRIQWLLEHPEVARTAGRAGRTLVLENYTWAHNGRAIMKIARAARRRTMKQGNRDKMGNADKMGKKEKMESRVATAKAPESPVAQRGAGFVDS